eukprot:6430901-Alexandrium_andersonii.AAC.1
MLLLLVGMRGQDALERELGDWLAGMLRARARRRGVAQHQWNLTAWAWLFHRAGIVESACRDPDLFDRAMQQAGISGAAIRRLPFNAWAEGRNTPMDGCPVGGLAARSEDAAAMDRVAFPFPPDAMRAF